MYSAAVLLPLLGFLLAGIAMMSSLPHATKERIAQYVTTGCVLLAALFSLVIFYQVGVQGQTRTVELFTWIESGAFVANWALKFDALSATMLCVVTIVSSMVHLYFHRLHGRGQVDPALHGVSVAVHLLHADAGDGRQFHPDVLRLGRRGARVLSADRLLVREGQRQRSLDQGVPGQPRRRFRLRARHLRGVSAVRLGPVRPNLRLGAAIHRGQARIPGQGIPRADADLPAAVRRRLRQVRAAIPAHLAARRDGRPDAGFGPHPRRHHGDRGRVHGLPLVAAVRIRADRADGRDARGCFDRVVRRVGWPRAERHQARDRVFDLLAARLHVLRGGRVGLLGRDVLPDDPRLLQGAAVPNGGFRSSMRCITSRTCARWAGRCGPRSASPTR